MPGLLEFGAQIEALSLGIKALIFSANVSLEEDGDLRYL